MRAPIEEAAIATRSEREIQRYIFLEIHWQYGQNTFVFSSQVYEE